MYLCTHCYYSSCTTKIWELMLLTYFQPVATWNTLKFPNYSRGSTVYRKLCDWIMACDTLHSGVDCIYQISLCGEWAALTWNMTKEHTLFHHLHPLSKTHMLVTLIINSTWAMWVCVLLLSVCVYALGTVLTHCGGVQTSFTFRCQPSPGSNTTVTHTHCVQLLLVWLMVGVCVCVCV